MSSKLIALESCALHGFLFDILWLRFSTVENFEQIRGLCPHATMNVCLGALDVVV